jgi:hypothetical protein
VRPSIRGIDVVLIMGDINMSLGINPERIQASGMSV